MVICETLVGYLKAPDSNRHREAMQLQQREDNLLGTCSRQKAAAARKPVINEVKIRYNLLDISN